MATNNRQPLPHPTGNFKLAAVAFYTSAACFFLLAVLKREWAPWFALVGGLQALSGSLMLVRLRKAAAQQAAAAMDRFEESRRR